MILCLPFVARKLKKIGQQKNPEEDHLVQDLEVVQNVSPKPGLTFSSQVVFLNILESIEPEVVNAGHDYCQPDSAATLLTSLNELGERQLVKVVKWAKGLPGRTLLLQRLGTRETVRYRRQRRLCPDNIPQKKKTSFLNILSGVSIYWRKPKHVRDDAQRRQWETSKAELR